MRAMYPLDPLTPEVETRVITFDFGSFFPGITIAAPVVTCAVDPASPVPDGDPGARVIGSAAIGASPTTGQANQAAMQLIGTLLAGCLYRIQCQAAGSDGSTPVIWQRIGTE